MAGAVDADIIIVGGGLAGLAAARRVRELGLTALVFEAQDHCGGKLVTGRIDRDVFDFGGGFFDGHTHVHLTKLITHLNVPSTLVYERGDNLLQLGDGTTMRYNPREAPMPSNGFVSSLETQFAITKIEEMAKTLVPEAPHRAPNGQTWDSQTWHTFQANFVTYPVLSLLSSALRATYGAEPRDVSLLHMLHAVRTSRGLENWLSMAKGLNHKFVGGSDALISQLIDKCGGLGQTVFVNTPVTSIQQGRVTARVVTGAGKVYSARYVIVALPPQLAHRLEYVPALPPAYDQFMQRLPMGSCISIVATYRSTFWRERGLSGMALSDVGPVTAIFDHSTASQPALFIMLSGQKARELGYEQDAAVRKHVILRHVAHLLGEEAHDPISYKEKDWAADLWSRGGPAAAPSPGFYSGFGDLLRVPLGKIFFASSDLSPVRPGTMEGAVESGEHAANEVIQLLRLEKSYMPPASSVISSSVPSTGATVIPPTARAPPLLPARGPTGPPALGSSMSSF